MTVALLDAYAARRATRVADLLRPHLPSTGHVLDLGSGTGHNAAALIACGMTVVTTDVADLRVVGPQPVRCRDGELPFDDDAFDVAIVLYVLQYSEDPAAVLREVLRVAPRAVLLQSTYRGVGGRAYLALRELVTGRVAFRVARAIGFVAPGPSPLERPRLMTRDAVQAAAERAGARCTHAIGPSRFPVARDLLLLERAS